MSNEIDLLADSQDLGNQQTVPDSPVLQRISELVADYDKMGGDLKRMAELMATITARRTQIEQETLPTAMAEAGIASFVTKSGRSVKVETVVRGNIPALSTIEKARGDERRVLEGRRVTALDIVRQKWPGLIKTEVVVSLGKGELGLATKIVEALRKGFDVQPSVDETIHPQTLNSHFKELTENGKLEEIPAEPFALYVGPIAKIK